MIEIQDLTVKRGDRTVLKDYGLQLERGSILSILGANGVGKTTLLGAVTGILKPVRGHISIDGQIGFVPQLYDVPFSYSALDVALMGRARHLGLFGSPGRKDYEIVRRQFDLLGISHLERQAFNALSGGQRQLVVIAQALGSECDLLILDEPCSALDYKNQDKVLDLLTRLRSSHAMTILFTTHMPQHAVEIASHVLLMTSASQYLFGPVQDVLNADNLSELYDLPVGRADFTGTNRHTFAPLFLKKDTPSHV